MSAADEEQALESIETAEKRLAALQELGCDVAALRSQLAFARTRLQDGRASDVPGLCAEVLATARRLAEGAGGEGKPRTGRFTRDQLGEALKDLLSQGLFARLLAEHHAGPDPRLEARFAALREEFATRCDQAVAGVRAEHDTLRADLARFRQELTASAGRDISRDASRDGSRNVEEPAWAVRLHERLTSAIEAGSQTPQRLADLLAQHVLHAVAAVTAASSPAASAASVPDGQLIVAALHALGERLAALAVQATTPPAADINGLDAVLAELRGGLANVATALVERQPPAAGDAAAAQVSLAIEQGLARLGGMLATRSTVSGEVSSLIPAVVAEHETTREFDSVSTRTERQAVPPAAPPPLDTVRVRRMVADEIGQQLDERHEPASAEPMMVFDPDQVRSLVVQEIERRLPALSAPTAAATTALTPANADQPHKDLKQQLVRLLPEALRDHQVQQAVFALLALEAVAHPGALGELTGLRAFLRRELKLIAGDLSKDLQVV